MPSSILGIRGNHQIIESIIQQLERQVERAQTRYNLANKEFLDSIDTDESSPFRYGNHFLAEKSLGISEKKQILIDAIEILKRY